MEKKETLVKVDSRHRITIPKQLSQNLNQIYRISESNGTITLEPVSEIPEREKWLLDPKNKPILDQLKKALDQKATIDFDEFKKTLKKK